MALQVENNCFNPLYHWSIGKILLWVLLIRKLEFFVSFLFHSWFCLSHHCSHYFSVNRLEIGYENLHWLSVSYKYSLNSWFSLKQVNCFFFFFFLLWNLYQDMCSMAKTYRYEEKGEVDKNLFSVQPNTFFSGLYLALKLKP